MGMFDTLLDEAGHGWQTKAYDCELESFRIGDEMPGTDYSFPAYQVEVLGSPKGDFIDSFATVKDGSLVAVPADRDESLPLLDYFGGCIEEGR